MRPVLDIATCLLALGLSLWLLVNDQMRSDVMVGSSIPPQVGH